MPYATTGPNAAPWSAQTRASFARAVGAARAASVSRTPPPVRQSGRSAGGDSLCDEFGVLGDPSQQRRSPRVLPRHAEKVEAR